jgi:hypothetical protein
MTMLPFLVHQCKAHHSDSRTRNHRKIISALLEFLRGKGWVEITTPRQINDACAHIVRESGVSLQKLNKKLKKGSWRDKLVGLIQMYPNAFELYVNESCFYVCERDGTLRPPPNVAPAAQATVAMAGARGGVVPVEEQASVAASHTAHTGMAI